MKRLGRVFDDLVSMENLQLAFYRAQKGKSWRKDVVKFRSNLTSNLYALQQQLIDGSIKLGHYTRFWVWEPKKQEICTVPFPERVVHHAIINICGQRFETYQIDQNFACRKDKGGHRAIALAQKYSCEFPWYLKLDVHKYFDHVDHLILMQVLERLIKDPRLLELLWKVIDSTGSPKGIPIGNLTSQFFANIYLSTLDHFAKEKLKIRGYCRYMDDFLCFGETKEKIKFYLSQIEAFLREKLLLDLNVPQINKTIRGVPFLGYRIFPNRIRLGFKAKKTLPQEGQNSLQSVVRWCLVTRRFCQTHRNALWIYQFGRIKRLSGSVSGVRIGSRLRKSLDESLAPGRQRWQHPVELPVCRESQQQPCVEQQHELWRASRFASAALYY